MVVNYLEKIREKFQGELIEIKFSMNEISKEQRENAEIIKLLELNDDPYFEAFTPRPVNSFNKSKILELKEKQKLLKTELEELQVKCEFVENEIMEVTEVIRTAKECIL